jgi:hypothetical protein
MLGCPILFDALTHVFECLQAPPTHSSLVPVYFNLMLTAGVPHTLLLAAGPTLVLVAPAAPPIVSTANTSVCAAFLPAGLAWTTDPTFPVPTVPLLGWQLHASALLPTLYSSSSALMTAPGVRVAKYNVRASSIWCSRSLHG